jgi:hypothetical protein
MTQQQREALFDLITLAPYADSHLTLREEELSESAFIAEGWESEHPKSLFLDQSLARAREAAETDEAMSIYVKRLAAHFQNEAIQHEAYGVVHGIISRDGINSQESKFLKMLQSAFPKVV